MDSKYLILATSIMVAGCSGGGGSNTATQTSTPNTGVFLDSAVEGIDYSTSTASGTTNANGEFQYNDGETVTLSIGDIDLPPATGGSVITPLDLVNTQNVNDTSVVNIARLLQSLDTDGDPTNGISISDSAHLSATGITVDFGNFKTYDIEPPSIPDVMAQRPVILFGKCYKSGNNLLSEIGEVSTLEDLKNFAVSRIFLDNFPHLKAYWPMIGKDIAQLSLSFGVDDIDGTIDDSTKIYSMAGSEDQSPKLTSDQLVEIIREAGRIPVERDTLYNKIRVYS